MYKVFNWK